MLSVFPSSAFPKLRPYYRALTLLAAAIPVCYCSCTVVYTGKMPVALPTLLYGGVLPWAHSRIWG